MAEVFGVPMLRQREKELLRLTRLAGSHRKIQSVPALVLLALVFASLTSCGWLSPEPPTARPTGATSNDRVSAALGRGTPVVAEFGSNACASCREMKAVLAQLSDRYRGRVEVIDIDIVRNREYIQRYQIQAMPTQVFYGPDGRELSRNLGTVSADEMVRRLGLQPLASAP